MPRRLPPASLALSRAALFALAAALLAAPAGAAEPAKRLFAARATPAEMAPAPIGGYAEGCLAGGVALPETGPGWQAMRLSRNRNWAHPSMIAFIERLAASAQAVGWPGLYVGDISQPRGGPMPSGHRSHQIGLDADIWLRRPGERTLGRAEREEIGSFVVVAADRRSVNGAWTASHQALLRAAARDPAVARIFVNAAIKRELCNAAPPGDGRAWLGKIRPWYGHDEHFHVRLNCPAGAAIPAGGCVPQDPVPPGDGCDASLAWWFTDEALNPAPGPRARDLTMADLPPACADVLTR
jgi:penicillin-insensitive murein endopeptidase